MDIEKYLVPISDDNPCGDDLEYDVDFRNMEQALEGKPELQMGNEVRPSEEPDWKTGKKLALQLMEKTRDVRVAVMLTQSLTNTDGFAGLANGMSLILGLQENFWDCIYPQQDPEDDYPISRMNSLMALGETGGLVKYVRHIPLVTAKGIGQFSLLDIDIAQGRAKPVKDDTDPATEAVIGAAFAEVLTHASEKEKLEQQAKQVTQVLETLKKITNLLIDNAGVNNVPDFGALITILQSISKVYGQHIQQEITVDESSSPETTQSLSGGGSGIIQSREEALNTIDRVCDYFEHYEPSSPVPLILRRARRLVNKDFMEILQDIVPDSVNQAKNITGDPNKE